MFFRLLGRAVRRGWLFILAAWVVVFLVARFTAPAFNDVAKDSEFSFLPSDVPSRHAEEVFRQAFPDDRAASNVVLVLTSPDGGDASRQRMLRFITGDLEPGLWQIAQDQGGFAVQAPSDDDPLFPTDGDAEQPTKKRSVIARIRSPATPGSGALLVSPDGRAMLVVLETMPEFLSSETWPTIDRVSSLVSDLRDQGKVPEGVQIDLTGSAVIGRDHARAQLDSVRATEWLTVAMVVGLLIVIYRAPLLAVIPLATVYLGVQLSLYLLALLAGHGHAVLFQGIQIYIVILAYGAGVDYCLFLTARCREEMDKGGDAAEAVSRAVGGTGAAVLASAGTVMVGVAMMTFARFGKFQQAGFAIPFSLAIVLAATLTFSPSLLRLTGSWAFWPAKVGKGGHDEPPRDVWHRLGDALLRRPAAIWAGVLAVMVPFVVVAGFTHDRISYDMIGELPSKATSTAGTRAVAEHFSPGVLGPPTVLLIDRKADFRRKEDREAIRRLTERLMERKQELNLADVRSLTSPLGSAKMTASGYEDVPEQARREAAERAALEHYTTDLGGRAEVGTRLELVMAQGPFDRASLDGLGRIESAIREAMPREDVELYVVGSTASMRDLAAVMRGDRWRIELLVLGSVFVVLVVLLRSVIVPAYLLLSVLFSYYVTMGATFLVFWALAPAEFAGIDWKVSIFLFTILIAVGEDYNIFLMTRVHEEEGREGPERGVTAALARTGPIISSCGLIMAGTFASLLAGSLTEMKQLGFALPFGVLLDTFVVRPVLLPAFLILLARFRRSRREAA